MVIGVVLALGSALLYGTSDFLAGTAARRIRVLPTTAIIYGFAVVGFGLLMPMGTGVWSLAAVLWGALDGILAIIGFLAFYAVMAAGSMSVMAPLLALLESSVPVAISVALGQHLRTWGWIAVGLAILAGILLSVDPGSRGSRPGGRLLLLSLVSGVSLGLSVVALDLAPRESGLVPGMVELLVGLVLLGVLALLPRIIPRTRAVTAVLDDEEEEDASTSRRRALTVAAFAGLLLGLANALLIFALRATELAIVSVSASLYPIATILLARTIIKERLPPVQVVGVAAALVATTMLAVTSSAAAHVFG